MLRTGCTSPVCRAEHRSFCREWPVRGAAGRPHVGRGAGAPSADPRQKRGAQDTSGNRAAFLLDIFLWRSTNSPGANLNSHKAGPHRAKTREGFRSEKYLALGCENPVQINCRVSDALNLNSTECVTSMNDTSITQAVRTCTADSQVKS